MADLNEFPFLVHTASERNRFLKRLVIKLSDRLHQLRLRDSYAYFTATLCADDDDHGEDGEQPMRRPSLSHTSEDGRPHDHDGTADAC